MKKIPLLCSFLFLLGLGTTQAQFTNIHNFYDTLGMFPVGKLVLSGNTLYGMTSGTYYPVTNYGNIYSVNTDGTGFKVLWNFNESYDSNGAYPYGSLTLVGGKLYGMTSSGGVNGTGNIFKINTDGSGYHDLWDFDYGGDTNGSDPNAALLQIGKKLYGMTEEGGIDNDGNIFSIDTDGSNYHDILDFNYSNGAEPEGSLINSAGVLYGMSNYGGANGDGNAFRIDTDGTHFVDLIDFNNINGGYPEGSLTLSGNKLFGMTADGGGGYDDGVIFSVDSNGSNFKDLLIFNYNNGEDPEGDLTLSGNTLYGMTSYGGAPSFDGNLFEIDTDGTNFNQLVAFNATNGENPYGSLTLSEGTLYGVTNGGGSWGWGIVFSDDICNLLTVTHDSVYDNGTHNGIAVVYANGGPTPYSYLWAPGGQTTDSISHLSAGTYTCTVTDANGCKNISSVTVKSTTGINNMAANAGNIIVYPNPNNGNFTIQLSGVSDKSSVEVYNTMGQMVYTGALASGNNTVDLNTKSNGVYLYRIISETGSLINQGKLVIQK